ncbi:unnamed protein product [Adineta steineri]|uniref:Uncharacterized protein n=1 Tax=Adineta steineri TaxID=433720 RepID=A0A813XZC9_9BILA|nr:unnamed protein product [Adineta steineri]
MNNRINRDGGYVLVQDKKQSKGTQYYDDSDDDDDNDSQMATVTRRVIRTKPTKEQRIKYISTDDLQYDHRRQSIVEPNNVRRFILSLSYKKLKKPVTINPSIPSALLTAPVYHPLTVFNPTPGVMVYETPLPYSAIDPDNAICPVPLIERPGYLSTNRYLDREDVIQGTMTWKNMSSTGLSALSQVPTMSNVWLPRWNDPFSQEILPTNVPSLLHEMPSSDRNQLLDDEMNEETKLVLTPEMIRAEFIDSHVDTTTSTNEKQDLFPSGDKLPESNVVLSVHGRPPRFQREQELDYFQRKKFGELIDRVNKCMEKNHSIPQSDLLLSSDNHHQQQQQEPVLIEPSQ